MFSTAGFTCVSFVAGALAWWGPKIAYKGILLQENSDPITFERYVLDEFLG